MFIRMVMLRAFELALFKNSMRHFLKITFSPPKIIYLPFNQCCEYASLDLGASRLMMVTVMLAILIKQRHVPNPWQMMHSYPL